MTNLNPEICHLIKKARRAAKLSQEVVANEVGCKQSALCMFEQGDGTKLNDAVVEKLAKKFGIELAGPVQSSTSSACLEEKSTGYCPNPRCPTNHAYEVEGRTFLLPDRAVADPVGGKFCAMCGESLVRACPSCGSPVHGGGFCSICGDPYVAPPNKS